MEKSEDNESLVSVVLPTYNRGYILSEAIKSILNQSYKDFELIIVDDGSTDNTEEVIESFSDSRIRYIKHDVNKGLSAGRNTGIKHAQGIYIANQDSDDVWLSHKLEKEVAILDVAPRDVGVVYSKAEKVMRDGKKIVVPPKTIKVKEGNIQNQLLHGNFITMQAALFRKECLNNISGFDETLPALQDWDFWLRISENYKFKYINEVGLSIKISADSITKNQKKRLLAREMIFNKHIKKYKKHPQIFAELSYKIGHAYALLGNMGKARKYLLGAMKKRFFMSRYVFSYILAIIGSRSVYKKTARLYVHMKR